MRSQINFSCILVLSNLNFTAATNIGTLRIYVVLTSCKSGENVFLNFYFMKFHFLQSASFDGELPDQDAAYDGINHVYLRLALFPVRHGKISKY